MNGVVDSLLRRCQPQLDAGIFRNAFIDLQCAFYLRGGREEAVALALEQQSIRDPCSAFLRRPDVQSFRQSAPF
ncbi:MAG: hypothetical protein DLM52_05095 [Chthoniobacterales bacterium]|nr:MAG: hypothetical protein DLM52_05095 [Chthoniobacterales bacterium]